MASTGVEVGILLLQVRQVSVVLTVSKFSDLTVLTECSLCTGRPYYFELLLPSLTFSYLPFLPFLPYLPFSPPCFPLLADPGGDSGADTK
jgi:hypothetical protein